MTQETPSSQRAHRTEIFARFLSSRAKRRYWIGYLFIAPWMIGLVWFDLIPFVVSLYLSFTDYSVGLQWPQWIGGANYIKLFTEDAVFLKGLYNTSYYLCFSVPLRLICALIVALLLNTKIRGRGIFRTLFYIPSVVPVVATAVIFTGIFHARYGILNHLLILVGLNPVRWLTSPQWVKPSMILMSTWGFGAQMVIFLAALQGIPGELYEAADLDGVGGIHKLMRITIPLISPSLFFNLIIGIIEGFQVFTQAYVMIGTDGGPLQAGLFYLVYLYNNAFRYFKMGYASAMSLILFLIILCFTIVLNYSSKHWVYYSE